MAVKHFQGGRILHGTGYAGYKYGFFAVGTSTPKTTYKDYLLTSGNTNTHPLVLDANGAGQAWYDGSADVTFYDPNDAVIYTDNGISDPSSSTTVIRTITTINATGATTITAAAMLGGIIKRTGMTANSTDTFDTAANIVAAISGCTVGHSFEFTMHCQEAPFVILNINTDTGITKGYNNATFLISLQQAINCLGIVTNATVGTEAVTIWMKGASYAA